MAVAPSPVAVTEPQSITSERSAPFFSEGEGGPERCVLAQGHAAEQSQSQDPHSGQVGSDAYTPSHKSCLKLLFSKRITQYGF